ncbi:MAG: transposase [Thiomicrorhabdus sp.]|nr:transposase [Thiomicrorhabdus sp.]
MRLSSLIKQFEADYFHQYGHTCLPSHRKAVSALKQCRSEYSPLMKLACGECEEVRYLPHSCGHRHCPHCQHHESQTWIDNQLKRQVKGKMVLITFTIPAEFRPLFYAHQRKLYSQMFANTWEILQRFAKNDKQLQGIAGAIAVLHTHSRRLNYHPHLHILMPMAAFNKQLGLWREKKGHYLFNHKALAKVFRAKMLDAIRQLGLALPIKHPEKWVVDCKAVGDGGKAIVYLGRYLYRGVIQEKDIIKVEDGNVTFRYQDGKTKTMETRTVSGAKFLWLLMQHVLPKRFRRTRNYGFLHPNSHLLKQIQLITRVFIKPLKPKQRAVINCPCCGSEMKIVQTRIERGKQRGRLLSDLKPQGATL